MSDRDGWWSGFFCGVAWVLAIASVTLSALTFIEKRRAGQQAEKLVESVLGKPPGK
jgi:hypothetical protein